MSDEIEPALTPEEWAARRYASDELSEMRLEDGALVVEKDTGGAWYSDEHEYTDRDRHALAALALYGQPFGFTRTDVDAIRWAARLLEDNVIIGKAHGLLAVADRIEALLPPAP